MMTRSHAIICGDCHEILKNLPSESIDFVLTSPPYDNLRSYESCFDVEVVSSQLLRVLKPGGCVVWVTGDATLNGTETLTSFRHAIAFREAGFLVNDTMIFMKKNPVPSPSTTRYQQCFEYMFVFSKGKPKTFNPITEKCKYGGYDMNTSLKRSSNKDAKQSYRYGVRERTVVKDEKVHSNVFEYAIGHNRVDHPATFPVQLATDMVQTFSDSYDVVLDPFAGSGTTMVAAFRLGRRSIMIDIDDGYCRMMRQRLNEMEDQG